MQHSSLVHRLPTWSVLCLYTVIGLLLYGTALRGQFLVWDDRYLIRDNPMVQQMSPLTIRQAFTTFDPELYIPVTFVSYQMDALIGGQSPMIYHTTNLVLHIANAVLAFLLLTLLRRSRLAALLCGLLFLVHPINVEAVAWASARKDVLSAFFALASICLYIRYCERKTWHEYVASVVLFALALLAKVPVLVLPAVLLIIDLIRKRPMGRQALVDKIPYAVLSVVLGIVAVLGKSHVIRAGGLTDTILLAFRDTTAHLLGLIWPVGFAAIYPYTTPISLASRDITLSIALVIGLLVAIVISWRRTRIIAYSCAIFLLFLLPSFTTYFKSDGIFLGSDRYVYMAWIGLLLLVAWAIDTMLPRLSAASKKSIGALLLAIFAILGCLTFRQSLTWHDTQSLFGTVLHHEPDSVLSRINIAVALRDNGDKEGALLQMQEAQKLGLQSAKVHSVTGSIYRAMRRLDDAKQEYEAALALQPDMAEALFGLGLVYEESGKIDDAIAQYEQALRVDPLLEGVHNNLGGLYLQKERFADAQAQYEQAIAIHPLLKQVHFNLGIAYQRQKKLAEAQQAFLNALSLDPPYADAHANLAAVYLLQNNDEAARKSAQQALALSPQHPVALQVLAILSTGG